MRSQSTDPVFERLADCFQTVFPDLERERIPDAGPDTIPGWSSMQQVTLLSLMEETFGCDIDFEDIEASSFADMLELVRSKSPNV